MDRGVRIELLPQVLDTMRQQQEQNPHCCEQQQTPQHDSVLSRSKGLNVLLSTRDIPIVPDDQDWDCLLSNDLIESNNESSSVEVKEKVLLTEHQWEEHPSDATNPSLMIGSSNESINDEYDDDIDDDGDEIDNDDIDDSSSDVSYTPPSTLPVIWIDAERMAGYIPSNTDERMTLQQSMQDALWGKLEDDIPSNNNVLDQTRYGSNHAFINDNTKLNGITLARDFEKHVTDLFATGMARHADTSTNTNTTFTREDPASTISSNGRYLTVNYPEYLCRFNGTTTTTTTKLQTTTVESTARVWKKLLQKHSTPVVEHVLSFLRRCNRSLLWKYDLKQELCLLAKYEKDEMKRRQLEEGLHHWQEQRRWEQLDQLYPVREALKERLCVAQEQHRVLEKQRDRNVQIELHQRRLRGGGGLVAFDFESTVLSFPDADQGLCELLGLNRDDDDDENEDEQYRRYLEQQHQSDEEENTSTMLSSNKGEEHRSDGEDDLKGIGYHDADDNDVMLIPSRSKERCKRAARKNRQRLLEASQEAQHHTKLQTARAEEDAVIEMCTTHQFRVSMAMVNALTDKLQKVDNLLETLQEEEWAAKEAKGDEENDDDGYEIINDEIKDPQLSLLDQILAMILGTIPPVEHVRMEEHVRYIENEHVTILTEWKEYFGRLPPPLLSKIGDSDATVQSKIWGKVLTNKIEGVIDEVPRETPAQIRESLGIVENDEWDSDDGEELKKVSMESVIQPVGLRPGGRQPSLP